MKACKKTNVLLLFCTLIFSGLEIDGVPYDYSACLKCKSKPQNSQYSGGIIRNPEFNNGLEGWSVYGQAKLQHTELEGNEFVVAHSRTKPYDSVSQKLYLQKDKIYTFSAWIQVSDGSVPVKAMLKTANGFEIGGVVEAKSTCWSMLKGGFSVDASASAELYFESNDTNVDIWVDSISLQPFTQDEWWSHQTKSIEKARKAKVSMQAVDKEGRPLANAKIYIVQKNLRFPIGCNMNYHILNNTACQNWFASRFTVATFSNELKWDMNEIVQGKENYSLADAMLEFTKQHNIAVRGHTVLWDKEDKNPSWVRSLSKDELDKAVQKRTVSVMSRYKDKVISWDVVNENMHFNFFESRLGKFAEARVYKVAHEVDPRVVLFLNEFNTIEYSGDTKANPTMYLNKLREIQSFPGNEDLPMGIGLQGHFGVPNLPYIRASLDTLGAAGLPIWITELDVKSDPLQAKYLEQIMREVYSHPKVQGIVIYGGRNPEGCANMCLTDENYNNLAAGDVVDKLLKEWRFNRFAGITNTNGFLETSLMHGDYQVEITHPILKNSTASSQHLQVMPANQCKQTIIVFNVSV